MRIRAQRRLCTNSSSNLNISVAESQPRLAEQELDGGETPRSADVPRGFNEGIQRTMLEGLSNCKIVAAGIGKRSSLN
jgi:hypothetical protein